MVADEFKHTSFDEQQEFLKLSPGDQNLKIYLSSKETNGHVGEAFDRIAAAERLIDSMGKEIQNVRLYFSEHVDGHLPRADAEMVRRIAREHADMWSVWRFSRWFIPISIPASIMIVTIAVEVWRGIH